MIGQIYESLENYRTSKRRVEALRQSNIKVASQAPQIVQPRFGNDILAGLLAVLSDVALPDSHPVTLEAILRYLTYPFLLTRLQC